ncbi:MAG TPA: hypothetical protein VKB34_21825, partial [Povalibacter sp.]|nr:hypothetical protein [Povalibacter sp.]
EINWYMFSYLGCLLTTADGKNYRFGRFPNSEAVSASSPIEIYIPPGTWRPKNTADEDVRALALKTLRESAAMGIWITFGSYHLHHAYLTNVADAIESGKIAVRYDASLSDPSTGSPTNGAYVMRASPHFDGNTLYMRHKSNGTDNRSVIVHEATHAMVDILGWRRLAQVDFESLAYIAQQFYLNRKGATLTVATADEQSLMTIANMIVGALQAGGAPDLTMINAMRRAVYAVGYTSSARFSGDGV